MTRRGAGVQGPESHRLVVAAAGQPTAVRAEGEAVHVTRVSRQRLQERAIQDSDGRAIACSPEPHGAIGTPAREILTVRAEGDSPHRLRVLPERALEPRGNGVVLAEGGTETEDAESQGPDALREGLHRRLPWDSRSSPPAQGRWTECSGVSVS